MHLSREAIGERLKNQRKQLGFTQDFFAAELRISKRTLAGYEAGTSDIGASVLARAWEVGVDVQLVVTGVAAAKTSESLSSGEASLLDQFRLLSEDDQTHISRTISALAYMPAQKVVNGDK